MESERRRESERRGKRGREREWEREPASERRRRRGGSERRDVAQADWRCSSAPDALQPLLPCSHSPFSPAPAAAAANDAPLRLALRGPCVTRTPVPHPGPPPAYASVTARESVCVHEERIIGGKPAQVLTITCTASVVPRTTGGLASLLHPLPLRQRRLSLCMYAFGEECGRTGDQKISLARTAHDAACRFTLSE